MHDVLLVLARCYTLGRSIHIISLELRNHSYSYQSSGIGTGAAVLGAANTGAAAQGRKHASLFTWLTLQSIPEETVICPHILDFLELALEPLPLPQPQKTPTETSDAKQEGRKCLRFN